MDLAELLVREQIRDTIARYNHAGDSGRFDEMVEQFSEDGVLELRDSDERVVGRTALRAFFAGVAAGFAERTGPAPTRVLRHCVTNTVITVDGITVDGITADGITADGPQRARADSYFLVVTDAGLDHWGRYRDEFAPEAGRWLLVRRQVRTDGYAPGSAFR